MAAEEPTQLTASQLRIVFPVSSGAVHKENAEWIPVEKNDVPKSCTTEQKKHVALTSLEIDRCRAQGIVSFILIGMTRIFIFSRLLRFPFRSFWTPSCHLHLHRHNSFRTSMIVSLKVVN